MARTVVAIYDDFLTANAVVRELVDNGLSRDNISLIANNTRGEYGYNNAAGSATTATAANENVAEDTGAGAGVGAGIGAAIGGIGGLLVGLGALTIPGIGPVIAAGPLAVALSTLTGAGVGAVAGGVTGGLLGALIGLGIPEEEAEAYAEGVRRGGVLVTVQAEDSRTDQIMDILNHHDPVDIHDRAVQWREQGWKGYNANGQPVDTAADQTQTSTEPRGEWRQNDSGRYSDSGRESDSGIQNSSDRRDFDPENPTYRQHYSTALADSGYPYDYYLPAYQYGYGIARNARFQNSTWAAVVPDVRREWEREHPGTWERYQDAIRHGWEQDVNAQPPDQTRE